MADLESLVRSFVDAGLVPGAVAVVAHEDAAETGGRRLLL